MVDTRCFDAYVCKLCKDKAPLIIKAAGQRACAYAGTLWTAAAGCGQGMPRHVCVCVPLSLRDNLFCSQRACAKAACCCIDPCQTSGKPPGPRLLHACTQPKPCVPIPPGIKALVADIQGPCKGRFEAGTSSSRSRTILQLEKLCKQT